MILKLFQGKLIYLSRDVPKIAEPSKSVFLSYSELLCCLWNENVQESHSFKKSCKQNTSNRATINTNKILANIILSEAC